MGRLVIAELAVPHPKAILIGCFLSTVGAGLQSLTGAPRLLQAIASDGVIPLLAPFKTTDGRGEPVRAILLTLCICEIGILIAVLESITALITQYVLCNSSYLTYRSLLGILIFKGCLAYFQLWGIYRNLIFVSRVAS